MQKFRIPMKNRETRSHDDCESMRCGRKLGKKISFFAVDGDSRYASVHTASCGMSHGQRRWIDKHDDGIRLRMMHHQLELKCRPCLWQDAACHCMSRQCVCEMNAVLQRRQSEQWMWIQRQSSHKLQGFTFG